MEPADELDGVHCFLLFVVCGSWAKDRHGGQGGMQRSARRDGEYRRERSERGTEPPLHAPGAVPPFCRGAVRQHGRGTESTQPASADCATTREAMTAAGHRHRAGRSPERDGGDVPRLSAWGSGSAGWRWSALVGRRSLVSGPDREWGLRANTARERDASGSELEGATATAPGHASRSRWRAGQRFPPWRVPGACLVLGGRNNAVTYTTTGAP